MTAPSNAPAAPRHGRLLIPVLAALTAFGPMSVDMYLPALPSIGRDLGVDEAGVQLTLSAFFLGFGGGQLLYGPIADRFGRRGPLLVGLLVFIVASLGCATAQNLHALIALRFLQAIGGCAGPVLARAIVRDLYHRDHAARVLSLMVLIMGIAPLLAPILGAQLLVFLGWRWIFWVQFGFGALCVAAVLFVIPETLPHERRHQGSAFAMVLRYGALLAHRDYLAYAVSGALVYGGLFAYLTGSPFVFITLYGVSPSRFSLLFGVIVLGLLAVATLNARLVMRYGVDRLLAIGLVAAASSGCLLLAAAVTGWGGLPALFVPLLLFISSIAMVGPNSMAASLGLFPERAGVASALAGMLQFCTGGLVAALLSALSDGTALPMAGVICGAGVLGFLVRRLLAPSSRLI
jgi:DHA1 family bicyclomycin/chloramphenicol resistance-like MFS transporter